MIRGRLSTSLRENAASMRGSRGRWRYPRTTVRIPHRIAAALALLAPASSASIIDVDIQGAQFTGQHLTIKLGDTVRWTNFDGTLHSVTEGGDLILNGNEAFHQYFPTSSASWSKTFDAAFLAAWPRPGNRYDYFCVPHGGAMVGSITVEDGPGSFFCFCSPQGPCTNSDYGAGCRNSTGVRGARLMGAGTTGVAADDLRLIVDLLPANKNGLFFRGTVQTSQNQLFNGWRCIGGTLYRSGALNSGAGGTVTLGPGVVALSGSSAAPISAGQTWLYQFYYRDALSPCGNPSNVSNGYSVTFVP